MIFTAKIEQTKEYPKRMKYIAETDSFVEKESYSLPYARKVYQPYGWIKESGTPPNPHWDIIIMTDREINDFSELTEEEKEDMHRLYPKASEGEGWFGREKAEELIKEKTYLRRQ